MKKQVLIVDDDKAMLKLLGYILRKDFDIISKPSGLEALLWLDGGNHPALVITDLMMPHIDGLTFLKNLRISGYYRNLPVLILSGAADLAETLQNIDIECSDFLEKPFKPAALKIMVNELLNRCDQEPADHLIAEIH